MKIAIPSVLPGGLEAQVGAHFGHCDCYTLVDVEDNRKKVKKFKDPEKREKKQSKKD